MSFATTIVSVGAGLAATNAALPFLIVVTAILISAAGLDPVIVFGTTFKTIGHVDLQINNKVLWHSVADSVAS